MKLFHSIRQRIILFIIGTFLVTVLSIFSMANLQLRKLIDESQTTIYQEKIQVLTNRLNETYGRLKKTGLMEAYEADFKSTAVSSLRETYYLPGKRTSLPIILDEKYRVILHPELPAGDPAYKELFHEAPVFGDSFHEGGSSFSIKNRGEEYWVIYKSYAPWKWYIVYEIPLREKYGELENFRKIQLTFVSVVTLIVLAFLSLLLMNVTAPIIKLAEIARRIADGELEHTIDIRSTNEIGVLAQSFIVMQSSIKKKITDFQNEITEREKAELALRNTRQDIIGIIDSMPSLIIAVDGEGKVSQWNSRAEEITGISREEAVNGDVLELYPELRPMESEINRALRTGEIFKADLMKRVRNKQTIYEDITVYPLVVTSSEGLDGRVKGAVIRVDDVTEKAKLEQQLSHTMKMEAIGQLAGGVAHDFNNMLTGIYNAAELLQLNCEGLDRENSGFLDLILEASDKARDLTAKLLAFGRKSEVQMTAQDLSSILKESVALLKRTIDKKIRMSVKEKAVHTRMTGDFSSLQNAILNLAVNASHAMPEGGDLTFQTRNIHFDEDYCEISPFPLEPGEYIELEVKDTGMGIPLDLLEKIFDPFFTTKETGKGTGLGLTSVYTAVQNHKGEIHVYSEVGQGTVFHLYFPCSLNGDEVKGKDEKIISGTGHILLIDDEKIIRLIAKPLLEKLGYQVTTMDNGRDGIAFFKDEHNRIDLVITDMIMPDMNGRDVFMKMREIDPNARIIISSGFTKSETLSELEASGLNGFLQKPFDRNEISVLINRVLTARQQ